MQTFPTHVVAGAWISEIILVGSPQTFTVTEVTLLLGAGITGAIAPDLVMVPMFLMDKIRGRQPMTEQGPATMALKELSHSLFVWLPAMFLVVLLFPRGIIGQLGFMFTLAGLFGGVLPDIPTHSEERFKDTDCTFLYPLNSFCKHTFGIDRIRWPNDDWEYRYDHGILWPLKPFELWINFILIFTGALALIRFIP